MRTFAAHSEKHGLHGITVVVETRGPEIFVGRCDDIDEQGVHLRDADRFDGAGTDGSRAAFLSRASTFGVWPNLKRITVPTADVLSIKRLAEIAEESR